VESITDISSLAPHRGKSLDFRMAVTQAVVRLTSAGVDGYIFPTGYLRTQLEKAVHMRFKKSAIIPDGVNVERFSPRPVKDQRQKVVLYVGNLRKRKGLEDLISAAPTVIGKVPDVRFVFVGEGLLNAALHRMVAQRRMEANFEFLGRISDEALAEQYNRTSVYVVPTRFDGYPTSVLEAMAFAKPVITTKDSVSDKEGIVVDGKTGFLVDVGDSKRLSEVILSLLEDRNLAETLGLNARALVASEHGLQKVKSELIRYLQGFLLRGGGSRHPDAS
jgi:glycosyltransferase involved in cell wall biosynthesis